MTSSRLELLRLDLALSAWGGAERGPSQGQEIAPVPMPVEAAPTCTLQLVGPDVIALLVSLMV